MSRATGGPAFPRPHSQRYADEQYRAQDGMTLRDYFAAKALSGLMANDAFLARCREDGARENIGFDALVATGAYLMADAMLAERDKAGAQ